MSRHELVRAHQSVVVSDDNATQPRHLRRRLSDGDHTPGTRTVDAAVLLSDVVSFTTHVEAMSGLGRAAVEAFSLGIGNYLSRVIEVVLAYDGDVLDVAGDSLLCVWEAGDGPDGVRRATARAASAAIAIQAAVTGQDVGHGHVLETRVGVAAGPVSFTVAGGVDDAWMLIAHGDAVARVEEAERRCPAGAVCVDDAVARLLAAEAGFTPIDAGLHHLTMLDRPVEPAVMPAPVAPSRAPLWDMGFRRLSLAIVRVPELVNASSERSHDIIRRFQRIVAEREGSSSLVTDNKGTRLIATFGAPPHAHEDDPARAVDAMRAFSDELALEGATCSAGIATGRLVHGVAGNEARRATTMAGDVINVAARLSTTANGTLLCDQETAVAAHTRYAFAVMNPIVVKGKAQPVPVFEPVAPVVERRRHATMRGRTAELNRLIALLDADADGPGAAVVVGDAGMGKTTLLDDFAERSAQLGLRTVVARTDAIDRTTPFLAWAPFVADRLGIRANGLDTTHASITAAARSLLRDGLASHASTLAAVFGSAARGAPPDAAEEPATVLPELIADLLTSTAHRAVIVFEDAHWADPGSLAVLRVVAAHPAAPPIVITTRPDGLDSLEGVTDPERTDPVELHPLGQDAVLQIIVDRLGTDRVPPGLIDFLDARAAGNPFFCEQILKSLLEQGTVVVNGPEITVGALDSAQIPATIEGVIVSRLDRLDPLSQQCLRAAAVVGSRHDITTVAVCLAAIDVHVDVAGVFDAMGADGLLNRADDHTYQFQHVIARDVVYDLMTSAQRSTLHGTVARHLEGQPGAAGAATIGRHWRAAGDHARALEHLERAATDALATGSFTSTIALLDEIAALLRDGALQLDPIREARLEVQRARASYYLGLLADARRSLERVIDLVGEPLPVSEAGHIAEHDALEAGRRAPDADTPGVRSKGEEVDALLFETYRVLVKVLYMLGENAHAILTVALRGVTFAERRGRRLDAASIQAMTSGAYAAVGNVELMEQHARESIAVAESDDGAIVANHVWRMLAVARAAAGQWAASLDASDRALAALDPEGQNRDAGIWQTRAAVHLCAGDFVGAEHAWQRTAAIAARDDNSRLARWSSLDQVQTMVGLGRLDEADRVLTDTLIELGPPSDPLGTIEQHYTVAILRSAQDRHAEAVREARAVVRMVEGVPPSGFHWVEFCAGAAEVMVGALYDRADPPALDAEALLPEIDRVVALTSGFAAIFPHVGPRALLLRALVAHRRGDGDATRLFSDAHVRAVAGGYEFDAARCTVLAALLGVDPPPGDLGEARDVLARLGAARWLDHADAAQRTANRTRR